MEIWKDIRGFEGQYQISNLGKVKSLLDNNKKVVDRIKATFINTNGYERVSLRNGAKKTIHRLVAEAFIENPNNKPQVNHIDGNKLNNCIDNLEWVTQSENNKHAFSKKLMKTNFTIKLSEKEVIEIRTLYKTGNYSYSDLAISFNVCKAHIGNIVKYKLWKYTK